MKFTGPPIRGELLRRYKRFLADVRLDHGEIVTAHCPNPGSMMGLAEPGSEVWLSTSVNPKRKLGYGLELVQSNGALVGVNTGRANSIAAEALASRLIPELAAYPGIRAEAAMGLRSRVYFLLEGPGLPICYLEVKSVTLRRPGLGLGSGKDAAKDTAPAEFPDAVTARGTKHLGELAKAAGDAKRAVILHLIQRGDCAAFRLAADIDPAYAKAAEAAREAGVSALCYACAVTPEGISLDRPIPLSGTNWPEQVALNKSRRNKSDVNKK